MTTKRKPEIIKPGAYYGYTEAQKRANKRYMENMVKINLTVSPERRETIKKHASVMNEKMPNMLIPLHLYWNAKSTQDAVLNHSIFAINNLFLSLIFYLFHNIF